MTEQTVKFIKDELGERAYEELQLAQDSFEFGKKHLAKKPDMTQVQLASSACAQRRILEKFVAYVCADLGGKYNGEDSDLFDTLKTLNKKKDISDDVFHYANQVRKIGNKGAHGTDLSPDECNSGLQALDNMIQTYMSTHKAHKKKKHTLLKVLIAVIVIAAIVVAAYFLITTYLL